MNISVTDIETGIISKAINVTYVTVATPVVGYTSGGSGSQGTSFQPPPPPPPKSHNHE